MRPAESTRGRAARRGRPRCRPTRRRAVLDDAVVDRVGDVEVAVLVGEARAAGRAGRPPGPGRRRVGLSSATARRVGRDAVGRPRRLGRGKPASPRPAGGARRVGRAGRDVEGTTALGSGGSYLLRVAALGREEELGRERLAPRPGSVQKTLMKVWPVWSRNRIRMSWKPGSGWAALGVVAVPRGCRPASARRGKPGAVARGGPEAVVAVARQVDLAPPLDASRAGRSGAGGCGSAGSGRSAGSRLRPSTHPTVIGAEQTVVVRGTEKRGRGDRRQLGRRRLTPEQPQRGAGRRRAHHEEVVAAWQAAGRPRLAPAGQLGLVDPQLAVGARRA